MTSLLVLVRHGQSYGNLTGDYSHRRQDSLTDLGWAQARAVAQGWDVPFDAYVCSPLSRTRQTIRPTLERFGVKADLWPDLAECCWQEPRSLPAQEPELPLVEVDFDADERRFFDGRWPPAAPSESERWQDGLRRMRRAAAKMTELAQGKRVLVVAHGYAISKLVMILTRTGNLNDVFDVQNTETVWLTPAPEPLCWQRESLHAW